VVPDTGSLAARLVGVAVLLVLVLEEHPRGIEPQFGAPARVLDDASMLVAQRLAEVLQLHDRREWLPCALIP